MRRNSSNKLCLRHEESVKRLRLSLMATVAILLWAFGGSALAQDAPWPTDGWATSLADQDLNAHIFGQRVPSSLVAFLDALVGSVN